MALNLKETTARDRIRARAESVQKNIEKSTAQSAVPSAIQPMQYELPGLTGRYETPQKANAYKTAEQGAAQAVKAKQKVQSTVGGELREEVSRQIGALNYLGNSAVGTVVLGAEAAAKTAQQAARDLTGGERVKLAATRDAMRDAKRYGVNSEEYKKAKTAYEQAMAEYKGREQTKVAQDGLGMKIMDRADESMEQALEGTKGAERWVRQNLISVADNALTQVPAMANPALAPVTLAAMSAKAGAGKTAEMTRKGATASEALVRGLISGGIEAATESVSLGSLLDLIKSSGKGVLVNLLKQSGMEAGEELTSYLANWVADRAARDPDAKFSLTEALSSAAGGAFSGLIMGGAGSYIAGKSQGPRMQYELPLDIRAETQTEAPAVEAQEKTPAAEMQQTNVENTRLNDQDLAEYLDTGKRQHVRNQKREMLSNNESPILTNEKQVKEFISDSIDGKEEQKTKAYGKVGERMAVDVEQASNGEIDIRGNYLELDSKHLKHMDKHIVEDEDLRNIPLTREQALDLPEMIDHYDEVCKIVHKDGGRTKVFLAKRINGTTIIVQQISKGRKAVFPLTAYQVRTEDYENYYKNKKVDVRAEKQNPLSQIPQNNPNTSNNSISDSVQNSNTEVSTENPRMQYELPADIQAEQQAHEQWMADMERAREEARKSVEASQAVDAEPESQLSPLDEIDRLRPVWEAEARGKATPDDVERDLNARDKAEAESADEAYLTSLEENMPAEREGTPAQQEPTPQDVRDVLQMNSYDSEDGSVRDQGGVSFVEEGLRQGEVFDTGAREEAFGDVPPEDTEHSSESTGYGTVNTDKIGLKVEKPITDLSRAEGIRQHEQGLYETKKQIEKLKKQWDATGKEIKAAQEIAAGNMSMEDYAFNGSTMRDYVVQALRELYAMKATYQQKGTQAQRQRIKTWFTLDKLMPVISESEQGTPPSLLSLHTNTWLRNNLRTFGQKLGSYVNSEIFQPVIDNEAGRLRWVNSQLDELRFMEGLTDEENALVFRICDGKADYGDVGPSLNDALIRKSVTALQGKYNDFYQAINDFLVSHGYQEIGFVKNYSPHMQQDKLNDALNIFQRLGFTDKVVELPTILAGRTDTFKPGKKWNPFFQQRLGDVAVEDAVGAYESYVSYLSDVFYHCDDIMKLRCLSDSMREWYSQDNVKEEFKQLREKSGEMSSEKYDSELERIRGLSDDLGKYGGYVTALDNYANILAGKQTQLDRAWENTVGRKWLSRMQEPVRALVRSSIPANLSSAINQTVQLPQVTAEVGERNVGQAILDIAGGKLRGSGFYDDSVFLTGKKGVEGITKKRGFDKVLDVASTPFEAVDDLTSRIIVRAKFLQATQQGMDYKAAMAAADDFANRVVGSRMKGAKPNFYADKNVLSKMLNTFQLEVANGWEHLKYDLPNEIRETAQTQGKQAATKQTATLFVKGSLYAATLNAIIKSITGNEPVPFDWIGAIWDYIKAGQSEEGFDATAGLKGLAEDTLDDIPYVSTIQALIGESAGIGSGNGRVPIPSLDVDGLGRGWENMVKGETPEDRAAGRRQFAIALAKSVSVLAPMGGQARKTVQGISDVARGGRLSDDGKKLLYEVEQSPQNWVRGALFGRSALPEAQDYYDGGNKAALPESATAKMKELEGVGISQDAYVDFYEQTKGLKSDEDAEGNVAKSAGSKKLDVIESMDLTDEQKAQLYRTSVASEEMQDKMSIARKAATPAEFYRAVYAMKDISGEDAKEQKVDVLDELGLSDEKAAAIYRALLATDEDTGDGKLFAEAKSAGISDAELYRYLANTNGLQSDKDKNGNTVDGSLDRKRVQAIDALKLGNKKAAALYQLTASDSKKEAYTELQKAGLSAEEIFKLQADGYALQTSLAAETALARAEGIGPKVCYVAAAEIAALQSDKDENGKAVSGSRKAKVCEYIDGLNLTEQQKDWMYVNLGGYTESGLQETPWATVMGLPLNLKKEYKFELPGLDLPKWEP